MQTIKGLLFDKDGTLFDFHGTWSPWTKAFITEIAADQNEADAIAESLGFEMGTGQFAADSAVIAGTPDSNIDAILQIRPDLDRDALLERIIESSAEAPLAPVTDLPHLMDRFDAMGLVCGVATNDGEASARAHLAAAEIATRFAFIAGFDSGYGAKPAPGMQHAFSQASGLAPEEIAMVGDSLHDLDAGRAAGMVTIAVLTGHATRDALAPHADVVLPHIGAIPAWIDGRA